MTASDRRVADLAAWMPGVFVLIWSTGFVVARFGMPHAPPMHFLVTSLMYLVPPCTALLAWLLFDELLTPPVLAGLALTALGVGLVVREPLRQDHEPKETTS